MSKRALVVFWLIAGCGPSGAVSGPGGADGGSGGEPENDGLACEPGCFQSSDCPTGWGCGIDGVCLPPECGRDSPCPLPDGSQTCRSLDGRMTCIYECDNDGDCIDKFGLQGTLCQGEADNAVSYCSQFASQL